MIPVTLEEAQQRIDAAMHEAQLLANVRRVAKLLGWRCYHTWNSQNSEAGFPDVVLLRPPRLIFAELKRQSGVVSPEQQAWLQGLAEAGYECYLWRPDAWRTGRIEAVLQ